MVADSNANQDNQRAKLTTELGANTLLLRGFSAAEGMSELFEFQVEAFSETENINFEEALGKACTVTLKVDDGNRFFCGILTHSQWTGKEFDYFTYRLVLRPWLWLLSCRADCRIFLNKSVKEIIKDVFQRAGFSEGNDFSDRANSGSYDKVPYCVQYRETDFAFVSRLMEQWGIYYYFEHSDGKHILVLSDSLSSHSEIPTLPRVGIGQLHKGGVYSQRLNHWTSDRRFRTGKIELNDYYYLQPSKKLIADDECTETYAHSKFEVYDFPGKYTDEEQGKKFAQFRLEAEQALDHRRIALGYAPSLYPGGLVTLDNMSDAAENKKYQVVRAAHRFGLQTYESGPSTGSTSPPPSYSGSYELLPYDQQFRSLPVTAKPRIYGIQTAKVVGKQGEDSEEISTDENGHVWVQFYWDREPQKTCPIRVAQCWSGKQWGGQFIPRLGMEVVVEFLEGDPDRPLVTGCVYNGDNKYPYTLPDNKTQSGVKSDSSKGHNGYNEFMFEDKKGSELIRMHAEKDHLVQINANQTGYVGAVELDTPYQGGDQTWTIGHNRTWTIQKGDDYLEVQQGNLKIDVDMGNYNLDVKKGNISVKADLGSITIEAMQSITLKVGSNQVVIDMTGVHIQGMKIDLQGNAMITQSAPMIKIN